MSRERFQVGVIWNVASLCVLGAAGLVLNTVIARYRSPAALGVFNEVFAVYIVLSQLCVGGVHLSVLSAISRQQASVDLCRAITWAGLLLASVFAAVVCVAAGALSHKADVFFGHESASLGVRIVLPGVFFFAFNKVLLNAINGHRHMRAFAVFNALRYVMIVIGVCAVIKTNGADGYLVVGLTGSEIVLFVLLGAYVWRQFGLVVPLAEAVPWIGRHLRFGGRGLLGGLLTEFNTRVDVVMLGWYLSESVVGVYSYAAIVAEGISQIPFAIRKNVDPLIGQALARNALAEVESLARRIKWATYGGMSIVCVVGMGCYPILLGMFLPVGEYTGSISVLGILLVGVALQSGYRPFFGVLLQADYPGVQTGVIAAATAANVALNGALIPVFGLHGAAMSTALALAVEAILVAVLARHLIGVRI